MNEMSVTYFAFWTCKISYLHGMDVIFGGGGKSGIFFFFLGGGWQRACYRVKTRRNKATRIIQL